MSRIVLTTLATLWTLTSPASAETIHLFGTSVRITKDRPRAGDSTPSSNAFSEEAQDEPFSEADFLALADPPMSEQISREQSVRPPTPLPTTFVLAGPVEDEVEVRTAGLTQAQIERVMDSLDPALRSCIPDRGERVNGTLDLSIVVERDGRVVGVEAKAGNGIPSTVAACVVDTLGEATFPAHDHPGPFSFDYLLKMDF